MVVVVVVWRRVAPWGRTGLTPHNGHRGAKAGRHLPVLGQHRHRSTTTTPPHPNPHPTSAAPDPPLPAIKLHLQGAVQSEALAARATSWTLDTEGARGEGGRINVSVSSNVQVQQVLVVLNTRNPLLEDLS